MAPADGRGKRHENRPASPSQKRHNGHQSLTTRAKGRIVVASEQAGMRAAVPESATGLVVLISLRRRLSCVG